ncbi:MAG: hypothetical protein ACK559_12960, partial [bacterium]
MKRCPAWRRPISRRGEGPDRSTTISEAASAGRTLRWRSRAGASTVARRWVTSVIEPLMRPVIVGSGVRWQTPKTAAPCQP